MPDGIIYYDWRFNDWLGSGTRAEMSLDDRAIYRDLLDHQAASGSLPVDARALANLAMCSQAQAQQFMNRWGDRLFPVSDDGRRRNPKMDETRSAVIERLDKRSRAGQAGADARWKNGKANSKRIADAMPINSDSSSDSSEGKGNARGKPSASRGDPPGFIRFWGSSGTPGAYPGKKQDRPKALESWKKQGCEAMADAIFAAIEAQKRERNAKLSADKFAPEWRHAKTWINQRGWEDDVNDPAAKQAAQVDREAAERAARRERERQEAMSPEERREAIRKAREAAKI